MLRSNDIVNLVSAADRFHSDVVGEFKAERDAEIKKKDEKLAAKRWGSTSSVCLN